MENDHEKIELLNYDTSIHGMKVPFKRAWSREFKNVLLFVSIAPYMLRKVDLKVLKMANQLLPTRSLVFEDQ